MSVADGFTLSSVGDLIFSRPISLLQDAPFTDVVKLLKQADVTFGNFEGSAFDIRKFKGAPQAEFGGVWIIGVPEVAKDLKALGFDMVARANNHTTDWGVEGMKLTNDALDEAGIVHAGSADHMDGARRARYLDTPKGRVALVSMATSFSPMSRAMSPLGEAPGRPGLNALRTTRWALVTKEEIARLKKIRDDQPAGSVRPDPNEKPDELTLFGVRYRASDRRGFTYEMDPIDLREITKEIRHGKQMSDFVVATIHAHDPGNWSTEPADFLPILARQTIDAGADAFVAHGPHQLRGIEVYKGKPIFYSMGNFIFHLDLLEPVGRDLYEQFKMDPATTTDAEFNAFWNARAFTGTHWYQSVIAQSKFQGGRLSEIRLYPVDLGYEKRGADRGVPRVASPQVAQEILQQVQRLSKPYGTTVAIEQNIGVIRVGATSSNGGQ